MFWFIIGIILGCILMWVISQVRSGTFKVTWYQWVLGVLAVASALFGIQNYQGFISGLEPIAAKYSLTLYGGIAVVLALLTWLIPILTRAIGNKKDKEVNNAAS